MRHQSPLSSAEFIALTAFTSALAALTIDAVLPALKLIGQDLGVVDSNSHQLVVGILFLGMAIGPIILGPLSDSIGRKNSVYIGLVFYLFGTLLCLFTGSFFWFLVGRIFQGAGASGARVVTMAMVRDQYEGEGMARVMSFVTAVFIVVPAVAPFLGQTILWFTNWHGIFVMFLAATLVLFLWFGNRQQETLQADNRIAYKLKPLLRSFAVVLKTKSAMGYVVAIGCLFGGFLGYLSTAQQIFQDIYHTGEAFAFYFGLLAVAFGFASFINGKIVYQYGMRLISLRAVQVHFVNTTVFLLVCIYFQGVPPFWSFVLYAMVSWACIGLTFGNLNALAMQPLGKVAGVGAAILAGLSTLLSMPLGMIIGLNFNMTLYPLILGFFVLAISTWVAMAYAQRHSS